jgi:hypothetical protein
MGGDEGTMGLFSRRNISRMLEENRRFLPESKLNVHVNHLNGNSRIQRLTTEWEVAVLNALYKLNLKPKFEPAIKGGTGLPDVLVTYNGEPVLIEITTASDSGLDEQNRVQELSDELIRRVRERGFNPDNFGLHVEGNWKELYLGGPKARLLMPGSADYESVIFNDRFLKFLHEIESTRRKATFSPQHALYKQLTITFNPMQRSFSCNYLDYTVPFTVRSNPVYNRLNKKAAKLKKAGFGGVTGLVLCDADCNILNREGRRGLNFGVNDIISNFLKEEPLIAFVLTLSVASDGSGYLGPEHLKITSRMYVPSAHPAAEPLTTLLSRSLAEQFPRPENTPVNAYSLKNEGNSFFGGGEMSSHRIKISARAVLEVLSGHTKQEDFIRDNPFAENFGKMLNEGRLFSDVQIEHVPERDDDWIEFRFSEPDPAVVPFRRHTT